MTEEKLKVEYEVLTIAFKYYIYFKTQKSLSLKSQNLLIYQHKLMWWEKHFTH